MGIHNYKKLNVWEEAVSFVTKVYQATMSFPSEEKYGLISQLRRASVSIAANIAEGSSRNTDKEFIQFLYVAKSSASEVETLLIVSKNLKFLSEKDCEMLSENTDKIERQIRKLINHLK